MNYEECCKLVDFLNEKVKGWYSWATAKPWDWEKCKEVAKRFGYK